MTLKTRSFIKLSAVFNMQKTGYKYAPLFVTRRMSGHIQLVSTLSYYPVPITIFFNMLPVSGKAWDNSRLIFVTLVRHECPKYTSVNILQRFKNLFQTKKTLFWLLTCFLCLIEICCLSYVLFSNCFQPSHYSNCI